MSNEKSEKKLNASQRLKTLEINMQEISMHLTNVARDNSMYLNNYTRDNKILREAVKLLGNKAYAIQKAAGITDDQVAALMIENNAVAALIIENNAVAALMIESNAVAALMIDSNAVAVFMAAMNNNKK